MTILYTTNTGSTKTYALKLSEKTGYDCMALKDAQNVDDNEEIIYMGWVMAGSIQGLNEARAKFNNVKVVCAVGMLMGDDVEKLKTDNNITEPFFYLRGCFDIARLKGMYRMMMGMMMKVMKDKIKKSEDPADHKALDIIEHGVNLVKDENLNGVLEYLGFEGFETQEKSSDENNAEQE